MILAAILLFALGATLGRMLGFAMVSLMRSG